MSPAPWVRKAILWGIILGVLVHAIHACFPWLWERLAVFYERRRACEYYPGSSQAFIEQCLLLNQFHPVRHVFNQIPPLTTLFWNALHLYGYALLLFSLIQLSRLFVYFYEKRRKEALKKREDALYQAHLLNKQQLY